MMDAEKELDRIAKLLVSRDFELSQIRNSLEDRLHELDRTAKILIRRDFELSQTLEKLRSMDEAKTHFVSIAAHQLRTPLSGIKWTLRLLLDGDLGEISALQREYIGSSYQTNERMIKLVNDLLNVSRIEEGRLEYIFMEDDLVLQVEKAVTSFQKEASQRQIALSFKKPKEILPLVTFDRDKIQMVLENLLENAVNYTASGGKVSVSLEQDPKNVVMIVKDTGIGIAPRERAQLFNKFYRSAQAVKMVPNGSGLGLFISQGIIFRHGGSIQVESEAGKGSTFRVILPKTKNNLDSKDG